MTTSNRGVKSLVFSAINYTNEVDDKGPVQRKTWLKAFYVPVASLSKKLLEDQEVLFGNAEILEKIKDSGATQITNEEIETLGGWRPFSELNDENRTTAISARYSDKAIDFTDREKAAIKHYWNESEDCGNEGVEAFEELETLLA